MKPPDMRYSRVVEREPADADHLDEDPCTPSDRIDEGSPT